MPTSIEGNQSPKKNKTSHHHRPSENIFTVHHQQQSQSRYLYVITSGDQFITVTELRDSTRIGIVQKLTIISTIFHIDDLITLK